MIVVLAVVMSAVAWGARLDGSEAALAEMRVTRRGDDVTVESHMLLASGDTIRTGAGEGVVTVPGCLDLVLYQYSSVTLEPFCSIRWNAGALLARAYGPMRVRFGKSSGVVLRTRFMVGVDPNGGVRVSTFEGVVRVTTPEGTARVATDESALVGADEIAELGEIPEEVVALDSVLSKRLTAPGALRPHPVHLRVGVEARGAQYLRGGVFAGVDGEVGGGFRFAADLSAVGDGDRMNLRVGTDFGWRPGAFGMGVVPALHVGGGPDCDGETLVEPSLSGEVRLAIPTGRFNRVFLEVEVGYVWSLDSRIESSPLLGARLGWDHAL